MLYSIESYLLHCITRIGALLQYITFTHCLTEWKLTFHEIVNTSQSELELFLEQCLFTTDDSGTNLF